MNFSVDQYIESVVPAVGQCINTGEFGDKPWKGFAFTVRDNLNDYDTVEDWREDSALTTQYSYRDFDAGNEDVIRGEFSLYYPSNGELCKFMIKSGCLLSVYDVLDKQRQGGHLSRLEQITLYMHENKFRFNK